MDFTPTTSIATVLLNLVTLILGRMWGQAAKTQADVKEAQEGMRKALATEDWDSQVFWSRRLKNLNALPK